jgi:phosphate transport system substrate-binding protein
MSNVFSRALAVAGVALLVAGVAVADSPVPIDPKLPAYEPVAGVSGNIKTVGSNTMDNLLSYWQEGIKRFYPNVTVETEGKGSNTAPPALAKGTATFGPMSRPMKSAEKDTFEKEVGYKPTELPASIDMLAVFVHKDNPVKSLSLQQIDAIFSKTRKGGYEKDVTTWGDLGLTGEWAAKPISLYGRDSASGTYVYFQEHALFKGEFKGSVNEAPGASNVVNSVAQDKFGIGYSGIGAATSDVRAVPIAGDAKSEAVAPVLQNAYSGDYPLSRYLYLYVNHKPGTPLDPLRREFVRYVFSREGQEVVVKAGFYPVTSDIAEKALKAVGINGNP